jgi:hypothetical protein
MCVMRSALGVSSAMSVSCWATSSATKMHYAARRRCGEPISTAFVEGAVNEIVAKRMNKKQQMRWNRATVQPFLDGALRC